MKKLSFLLWILIPALLFAQDNLSTANRNAINQYQKARINLEDGNIRQAIYLLNNAIEADNNFIEAQLLLADVYRSTAELDNAKKAYQKAFSINPTFNVERYFYLAETELKTGDYMNAKKHFNQFMNLFPEGKNIEKAKKYILDCDFSTDAVQHPVKFTPINLGNGVNTQYDEYMATVTGDENSIIFTRQIENNEDFYQSVKKDSNWTMASSISNNINTVRFNEGAQSLSPDGQFLFFTGCNRPEGWGRCDIYVSQKQGNDWSKPVNLGSPINTKGWESQPSISSDGKTIYFSSDRKGGLGGYDIWKSTLDSKGTWTNPINMGENINTSYDEQSPFIHSDDRTLYFASDGWPGLGNKDIYMSSLDIKNQTWNKPKNIGYPINTFANETGLTVNSAGNKAYFSSSSIKGFGGLDLYSFDIPNSIKPNFTNYVKGLVFDAKTKKSLAAEVNIFDLTSGNLLRTVYTNTQNGGFLMVLPQGNSYSLNVFCDGYLFYSESFDVAFHQQNEPINLQIALNLIEVGNKVILRNIYFDSKKSILKAESKAELQNLINFLKTNPNVKIEILGFTDATGELKDNQILSENRATSVYDYLIKNNISAKRLSHKGLGENNPLNNNETETDKALNRRTEFVITAK